MTKLVCQNGWTDVTWVECMICSHSETCEPFMLRRLRSAIISAEMYGFDVPDDVTTLDQFNEMFEVDYRDGGEAGVTRKSDNLYQGADWFKANMVLKDGRYVRGGI